MAYTTIYANGSTFNMVKKFVIDSFNEIYDIDTSQLSPGSTAFDISSSKTYVLNNKKQWIEVQVGTGGSGDVQPDWNQNDETAPDYVKNRPFYKDVKILDSIDVDISWDGDTTGKTASSQNRFYKVSDSIFTEEQFLQMYFICNGSEIAMSSPDVLNSNSKVLSYMDSGGPVIAVDIGGSIQGGPPDVFPETGVYFPSDGSVTRLFSKESILSTEIVLKKIDEEFIPDNVLNFKNEINNKLDSKDPNAFGSFSMGREYPSVIGKNSYAVGIATIASGEASHAEGKNTTASGVSSHAEGNSTTASGLHSHSEGNYTIASGYYSHAEGSETTAYGYYSHAEGEGTIASSPHQHVQGSYNLEDKADKYAHIVGNGDRPTFRSNAHTLDRSGNAWFAGDVYTGSTSGTNKDEGSKKLATEEYVDSKQVQSDWNQNDETAPDHVKNRPFYTGDPVETVLVEESTVSFAEVGGIYFAEFPSTFEATVGETYKVSWDDTVYECTCVKFNNLPPAIGNLSIGGVGSDTGEPFLVVNTSRGINIGTKDTAASHTFSISGFVSEVVKIDEKYLPDTIATKSEVEIAQITAENAQTTASNAQTTASNAQTTASNAQTTASNAKNEALYLAARMFGHTSVVDNAFNNDKTLNITSLPACIESIGANAFSGCTNLALTSLPSGITSIGANAFSGCTNLALTSLPSGITSIDSHAFSGCTNLALTSLPSGLTSIDNGAFGNCRKIILTSLPSGLTSIGGYAFQGCTKLALTSLPSGLTSIGVNAFEKCTGLTSITFTGTPTSINSAAFSNCTNLTTINVPWAEGAVANAPWGATNATINYNYTEV